VSHRGARAGRQPSLLANVALLLGRGYERLNSAIFDPDGDIMRL
jgi:hypothetical protein